MPDEVEVSAQSVIVDWGGLQLAGPGVLRLTSDGIVVESTGSKVRAAYSELRGGAWKTGSLAIHGAAGFAAIDARHGLEHAWVQLIARACPVPELARTHRLLGSRRGGSVDAQARFLAPLIQARKRLEEAADLESRIAAVDARALRERIVGAIQTIANDAHPTSHPDRRGLQAELEEVMSALFAELDDMDAAAKHFREAPEAIRFIAWRAWVSRVTSVFSLADTGWAEVSRLFPGVMKP
jgi:hypothetical protein